MTTINHPIIKGLFSYSMTDSHVPLIDFRNYEYKNTILGHGTYGTVYLFEEKGTKKLYAAKVLNGNVPPEDFDKTLHRELECLSILHHPAIISMIGYSPTDHTGQPLPTFLCEYMPNQSLGFFLHNKLHPAKSKWNSTKLFCNILGICLAMAYIHDTGLIHRDLKLDNVLIDENLYPRICDFGTARFNSGERKTLLVGTAVYMAPEIIDTDSFYTSAVDVYSFAMILYELYSGKAPALNSSQGFFKFLTSIKDGLRPDIRDVPGEARQNIIAQCWDNEPSLRPTFHELTHHFLHDPELRPDDLDENEVNEYLSQFGLSLYSDFIPRFSLSSIGIPSVDSIDFLGESFDKDDWSDRIMRTNTISDLNNLMLQFISEINDIPENCSHIPDTNEMSTLNFMQKKRLEMAENGNVDAYYEIGYNYCHGVAPYPVNLYYGYKYLKKAAEQGNPNALYGLAKLYLPYVGDSTMKSIYLRIIEIAIMHRSAEAAQLMAAHYVIGSLFPPNEVMAMLFFKYAADMKNIRCMDWYARKLRKIINGSITLTDLSRQIAESRDIVNCSHSFLTRTNEIRFIAKALFSTISTTSTATIVSAAYFKKILATKNPKTEGQLHKFYSRVERILKKIEKEEVVHDYEDDHYHQLYQTLMIA